VVGRVLDFFVSFACPHTPHLRVTLHLELTDSGTHIRHRGDTRTGAPRSLQELYYSRTLSELRAPASRRPIRSHINVVARYKGIKEELRVIFASNARDSLHAQARTTRRALPVRVWILATISIDASHSRSVNQHTSVLRW